MAEERELAEAFATLTRFLGAEPLTAVVADLEFDLEGMEQQQLEGLLATKGITAGLLKAAILVRSEIGRINDFIHAAAIALALPRLLEPGEMLKRPSLAAGNDPLRPFDVETDRRVAEFKFSEWDGHDAMRKRQVFKDFVNLAAEESDRRAELFVLGQRPLRFLNSTRSTASWALDRAPATRALFERRFGSLSTPIPEFVQGEGRHVVVIDLAERLPDLLG